MNPLKLSTRPPSAPAARMPSPQAWQRLLEDLEDAAECNRAQEEELEAVRAELGHTRQQLADEQQLLAEEKRVRGLCDDLVGSLFRQREYHAGHARYAYEQLTRATAANRRALDVIRDLRAQAHGLEPRPPAAGAVAVRST